MVQLRAVVCRSLEAYINPASWSVCDCTLQYSLIGYPLVFRSVDYYQVNDALKTVSSRRGFWVYLTKWPWTTSVFAYGHSLAKVNIAR